MFYFDEQVKRFLLHYLAFCSSLCMIIDRYWDQFLIYLLLAPFQWLHLMHLIYIASNNHNDSSIVTASRSYHMIMIMIYLFTSLIVWEVIRIVLYHSLRSLDRGDDVYFVKRIQDLMLQAKDMIKQLSTSTTSQQSGEHSTPSSTSST